LLLALLGECGVGDLLIDLLLLPELAESTGAGVAGQLLDDDRGEGNVV
jgi:hypothetical protein